MAVYVDNLRIPYKGKEWCHLIADDLSELHYFAHRMGIKKCWFHRTASYPHYDITIETRQRALLYGAQFAEKQKIIECGKKLKKELFEQFNSEYIINQIELF